MNWYSAKELPAHDDRVLVFDQLLPDYLFDQAETFADGSRAWVTLQPKQVASGRYLWAYIIPPSGQAMRSLGGS